MDLYRIAVHTCVPRHTFYYSYRDKLMKQDHEECTAIRNKKTAIQITESIAKKNPRSITTLEMKQDEDWITV